MLRIAIAILIVLNVGNAASLYAIFIKKLDFALGVIPLFNFDREANFPTLFNGVLLAGASFWSHSIARCLRPRGTGEHAPWAALGFVMTFLCLDELCHIHETVGWILMGRVETEGLINWPWVIPYAILAFCGGLYFLRFFLRMPTRYQLTFGIAGTLYVGGAIGLEMLEAALTEKHGEGVLGYGILYTIEENLEMIAVLLTNWGMMDFLAKNCGGLNLTLTVEE